MLLTSVFLSIVLQHASATIVNPVDDKIRKSMREVRVRRFAQIPDFDGSPSKIVGMTRLDHSLFVTTSTSGGLIYQVKPDRNVSLWFDVNEAMIESTGRPMSFEQGQHGGLRGLAFHPDFSQNGLFYVSCMEDRLGIPPENFTYLSRPDTLIAADSVVLEFRVNSTTREPMPTSYRQVLRIGMKNFDHPIKQIVFKGHYLYIAHGDGSIQSVSPGTGQANDGLGKILRIDPREHLGRPYRIPETNPFNGNRFPKEAWAVGFRNPHTLCFSRDGSMYAADVGRDNIEELNIVEKGGNYGWSMREGPFEHLETGALITALRPLPANDTAYNFTYPAAMFGHEGEFDSFLTGQAIATSCPIRNGSPLKGTILYTNFPNDGKIYLSFLPGLKEAVTKGPPESLTRASTYTPRLFFDHDDDPTTEDVEVNDMRQIVRMDPGFETAERANIRFGLGAHGEIYISAKGNGRIYLVTTSLPPGTNVTNVNSTAVFEG